ncbi:MAG: carbamoyltransferase [Abitibacteriaceae bacterium]|nr:carbamoyltransferase [Abditibacteriaceae bacterium]
MLILGVSCFFHDAAAALIEDGVLIAAAEEERFSRRKHDYNFPTLAIDFCLRQRGISAEDLDYVVFFEKPLLKLERLFMTIFGSTPRTAGVFREALIAWFEDKLWIKGLLKEKLGVPDDKLFFIEHHLSHAASAFLCSPFEEAAVLTVDGVGEWATTTLGVGKTTRDGSTERTELKLLQELRFPHSLGLLYSAFTAFLGFEVNEGEYKVMGMAPYGEPKYVDKVLQLLDLKADGSFALDLSYFQFQRSTSETISHKFEELFGLRRDPKARFVTVATSLYDDPNPPTAAEIEKNQYYADIAASIQRVTEEVLLKMAHYLHQTTGLIKLCIAGGVGLNSVANNRIYRETPFKELYVQPAAGDAGGAIGAALYAYNVLLGQPRRFVMEHAYWGEAYSDEAIAEFLQENNIQATKIEDEEQLLDRVVEYLTQGKVIGWYQGRFEWGPRALGNRSILADPRRDDMKDIINIKIKFREPFRPFAPSVLAERAEEYFDLSDAASHYPARFMLMVTPVREEKRQVVPAITHVDGTGRLQTVVKDTNPRYHRLIEKFAAVTGVPLLLNTSFNLRGEPIVTTPANAWHTFTHSDMDVLVLGNHLVVKDEAGH